MAERMRIDGELFSISPEAWKLFEDFWGDKAYRQAGFVEEFEALVLRLAAAKIRLRGSAHLALGRAVWPFNEAADLIDPDKEN